MQITLSHSLDGLALGQLGAPAFWEYAFVGIGLVYLIRILWGRATIQSYSLFNESFHALMCFAMAVMFDIRLWNWQANLMPVIASIFALYALGFVYRIIRTRNRWWVEVFHVCMALAMVYMTLLSGATTPIVNYLFIGGFGLFALYSLVCCFGIAVDRQGAFCDCASPIKSKVFEVVGNGANLGMSLGMLYMLSLMTLGVSTLNAGSGALKVSNPTQMEMSGQMSGMNSMK